MMIINGQEELEKWAKIQKFVETYLNRDVKGELIPNTILEVLEKQHQKIEELEQFIDESVKGF